MKKPRKIIKFPLSTEYFTRFFEARIEDGELDRETAISEINEFIACCKYYIRRKENKEKRLLSFPKH